MRRASIYLGLTAFGAGLLAALLLVHPASRAVEQDRRLSAEHALVADLGLTDLCLFTETPYTRHMALADLHTPFKDHPLAMEHYPSGSLVRPPLAILPGSRSEVREDPQQDRSEEE